MTHFNEVVEEEKARFIGTWLPNGKESEQPQMEADFDQAMHKAALAVERQLSPWLQHDATCFLYTEEGNQEQCDCGLYTLRKQLTDKE